MGVAGPGGEAGQLFGKEDARIIVSKQRKASAWLGNTIVISDLVRRWSQVSVGSQAGWEQSTI